MLRSSLEVLSHCEVHPGLGILSFYLHNDLCGEVLLAEGRVCLVSSEPKWAARFRERQPHGVAILDTLLGEDCPSPRPLLSLLEHFDPSMLSQFRTALREESARQLFALTQRLRAQSKPRSAVVGSLGTDSKGPGDPWEVRWSSARPPYPRALSFPAYEIYSDLLGSLLESIPLPRSPALRLFEVSRDDSDWGVLFLNHPDYARCAVPVDAFGEPDLSVARLRRLSDFASEIMPPRMEPSVGGLEYAAFGPRWNWCFSISDGQYQLVLASEEPSARARVAQRVHQAIQACAP